MDVLLKVCAIALVGVLATTVLRRSVPEISVAATAALILAMVFAASGVLGVVIEFIYELAGNAGIDDELLRPLIKCVGVSIVTRLGCDVCRDSGVSSAASYIELVGGAVAVMIAAPLMLTVLRQITV